MTIGSVGSTDKRDQSQLASKLARRAAVGWPPQRSEKSQINYSRSGDSFNAVYIYVKIYVYVL